MTDGSLKQQLSTIDGELYYFNKFMNFEMLKQEVEVVVDIDSIYETGYAPDRARVAPVKKSSRAGIFIILIVILAIIGAAFLM